MLYGEGAGAVHYTRFFFVLFWGRTVYIHRFCCEFVADKQHMTKEHDIKMKRQSCEKHECVRNSAIFEKWLNSHQLISKSIFALKCSSLTCTPALQFLICWPVVREVSAPQSIFYGHPLQWSSLVSRVFWHNSVHQFVFLLIMNQTFGFAMFLIHWCFWAFWRLA